MNISKKLMLCVIAGLSLSQITQSSNKLSEISMNPTPPMSYYKQASFFQPNAQDEPVSTSKIDEQSIDRYNMVTTSPVKSLKTIRKTFTLSAAGNGEIVSVIVIPVNESHDEENSYQGKESIKKLKTAHEKVEKKPTISFNIPSQFSEEIDGKRVFLPTEEICIQLEKAGSEDTDANELLHFHVDFESLENNETFYITSTSEEEYPMLITQNGQPNVNALAPEALYEAHATINELSSSFSENEDLGSDTVSQGSDMISSVEASPLAHLKDKENSFDSVAMPS
ncbi:MAG: hypothetical protein NTU89_01945 [Candidatus Dependentiae bacterium]|nr:hypothetical protein [Candidatus Dependentiae bacterium]